MSSTPGARNPKNRGASRAQGRVESPRGLQRARQVGGWRFWPWLLVGFVLAAAALFGLAGTRADSRDEALADAQATAGALVPEHTAHDFGEVRMGEGLISARFALAVQSPVRVARLETT